MNYDVVGIGNALVDIQVMVDDPFIEKLKLLKGGMILSSQEEQLRILESLAGQVQKISSGGSAANTIHGIGVLGGKAYYLGRTANDAFGHHYAEDMQTCGVDFSGPGTEDTGTGTSVILVTPDGQRTMITHLGVSAFLNTDNVDETIVRGSRMVYAEGYLWTGQDSRKAAVRVAEIAKNRGLPVAFTLSDAFIADGFKDSLVDFIRRYVDILFCNEVEAKTLTERNSVEEAFVQLQDIADTLFVTLGKGGSHAGKIEGEDVRVKAFPVMVVDTTGAGDLYAAGALYGMMANRTLEECAIIGSYCASQVVSHLGARMPVHSHTDLDLIIKSYHDL